VIYKAPKSIKIQGVSLLLINRDGNRTEPELNEPNKNPHFGKNRTELELTWRKHI